MASNKEIVKAVLRETTTLFNAFVSEYSSECEVKIVTKAVFVRLSDLVSLELFIEQKGCNIERELEYNICEFEHNGHAYISFDDMRSNFCVIHSPDCPCNRKEVQK